MNELYKNQKWLYNKYWVEKKSTREISKEIGCSPATIKRWIRRLGIKMRTFYEAQKLHCKNNSVWNKGLNGVKYLSHYKGNKVWNKGLTKEKNQIVRGVAEKITGKNHYAWMGDRLKIICDNCGKEVRRRGLTEINRSKKLFCCLECRAEYFTGERHPFWKGGNRLYYGPNWEKQRRLVLKRDDYRCQRCGNDNVLIVHHIIPFGFFGIEQYNEANQLENLLTCCNVCHGFLESESRMLIKEEVVPLVAPGVVLS